MKLWLHRALQTEEESWLSGRMPELIDSYCFSPLAVDVIQVKLRRGQNHVEVFMPTSELSLSSLCFQVMESSLAEFRCAIKDQSKAQRLTCLLETFLCR